MNIEKPKSCLPNGKRNPEYNRWYRNTQAGKEKNKKYQQSEKAKVVRKRYEESHREVLRERRRAYHQIEKYNPDYYADRIISELVSRNAQLY